MRSVLSMNFVDQYGREAVVCRKCGTLVAIAKADIRPLFRCVDCHSVLPKGFTCAYVNFSVVRFLKPIAP